MGRGTPTCQSSGQGTTSTPKEGPQALARAPRLRGSLEGKLGGCCLEGGNFKGSLIPGDIFRHRSLLFMLRIKAQSFINNPHKSQGACKVKQ